MNIESANLCVQSGLLIVAFFALFFSWKAQRNEIKLRNEDIRKQERKIRLKTVIYSECKICALKENEILEKIEERYTQKLNEHEADFIETRPEKKPTWRQIEEVIYEMLMEETLFLISDNRYSSLSKYKTRPD